MSFDLRRFNLTKLITVNSFALVALLAALIWSNKTELHALTEQIDEETADLVSAKLRLERLLSATPPRIDPSIVWHDQDVAAVRLFQSAVLENMQSLNFKISNFNVLEQDLDANFSKLSVLVEAEGSLMALVDLLNVFAVSRPSIAVETLTVRPLPTRLQREGATLLRVRLQAWGPKTQVND